MSNHEAYLAQLVEIHDYQSAGAASALMIN
jgi:hypothetical protein